MTTKIEWADLSINPIVGCSHCSPGCDNCKAERIAARLAKNPNHKTAAKYRGVVDEKGWTGKINVDLSCLAKLPSKPQRIFVGSMCDLFHHATQYRYLDALFAATIFYPQHTFLLLTKRPENMRRYISGLRPAEANESNDSTYTQSVIWPELLCDRQWRFMSDIPGWGLLNRRVPVEEHWPLNNIWLGVTVCNQAEADAKIPLLLQTPAAKRFVSVEPMLGLVDISRYFNVVHCDNDSTGVLGQRDTAAGLDDPWYDGLDWVICGGETGPRARPIHPDWVRSLRDQCQASGTPFFFKGWGEWETFYDRDRDDPDWRRCPPANNDKTRYLNLVGGFGFHGERVVAVRRVGKRRSGRLLDGREWNEVPEVKA